MSYLTDDISMAAVNEAKVVNLDESVKEAQTLLNNHLLDSNHISTITTALNKIKETEDYQVQPDFVEEIDAKINDVGNLIVSRGGDVSLVSGTESFGLTLSPKEWRRTRIAGCESILEELGKTIKNYSNKLAEKLAEIFTGHRYTIASLEERLNEVDKKLTFIEGLRDDVQFVTIPEMINKSLQVNYRAIATDTNLDKILNSEINFIGMAIKSWSVESTAYKNKLIRFFGNKGRGDFKDLARFHPKFLSKKMFIDEDNSNEVTYSTPNRFIGMGALFFTENTRTPESLSDLVSGQAFVGYEMVSEVNPGGRPVTDLNIRPIPIGQLENIRKTTLLTINLMKVISEENNDFDTDGRDIKDILSSLKTAGDAVLMDSFSGMLSHYQSNTSFTQGKLVAYLGQLASHLITFMFINMEGYDDA